MNLTLRKGKPLPEWAVGSAVCWLQSAYLKGHTNHCGGFLA